MCIRDSSYTFCRTPTIVSISALEHGSVARGIVRDGVLELSWPTCAGTGEVELLDMTGRMLTKRTVQWSNGKARMPLPALAQEVVIAHAAAGVQSTTLRIFIP